MLMSGDGQVGKKAICVHCFQHCNMYVLFSYLNHGICLFSVFLEWCYSIQSMFVVSVHCCDL
jgi:hypothetical protein